MAQTIEIKTLDSLIKKYSDIVVSNAESITLQYRFALGEGYCEHEQRDALYMLEILNYNTCKVNNKIKI